MLRTLAWLALMFAVVAVTKAGEAANLISHDTAEWSRGYFGAWALLWWWKALKMPEWLGGPPDEIERKTPEMSL